MICLSPSPSNKKVIRAACDMATTLGGQLVALYVETPTFSELSKRDADMLKYNLNLAEDLGAQIVTVYGDNLAMRISEYAKISGITKIMLGKTATMSFFKKRASPLSDQLAKLAPNLDIYIIPGGSEPILYRKKRARMPLTTADTARACLIFFLTAITALVFHYTGFGESNVLIVFILGVLIISVNTSSPYYGIVATVINMLIYALSLSPKSPLSIHHLVTFGVFLVASVIANIMTIRIKDRARLSARNSYSTQILLESSQKLQRTGGMEEILMCTAEQVSKLIDRSVFVYCDTHDPITFLRKDESTLAGRIDTPETAMTWARENKKQAGASTDIYPKSDFLYIPIRNKSLVYAVVAIYLRGHRHPNVFERNLLTALLGEASLCIEKDISETLRHETELREKNEKIRSNLLRSVSHDLRTPLTSISGNAGMLTENAASLSEESREQVYRDIFDDSMWLVDLVENLLSITRMEDNISISMEPEVIYDVVQAAVKHVTRRNSDHRIEIDISDDMMMAKMDPNLIMQVIINLLDNDIKYTPPGTLITVKTREKGDMVEILVCDEGGGIPDEYKEKIFDMFYTISSCSADSRRGIGMGLSLCRTIISAHGGEISVSDNTPTGCIFSFTLPSQPY